MQPSSYQERWLSQIAWHKRMREKEPISYDEQNKTWNVFLYEDVVRVLADPATFSSDTSIILPQQGGSFADMTQMDPPRHRQFRGLVSQAFTPRIVEQMAPRIAAIVNELLDAVAPQGEMDMQRDLSAPLPCIVIAELLGIPREDHGRFKGWSDALIASMSGSLEEISTAQSKSLLMQEMFAYVQDFCQKRRQHPAEDLTSYLIQAQDEGQTLSDGEIMSIVATLLIAGNITTTILLGNAILCLDEHPDAMKAIRADPSLLPSAIEEVLRYRPPFTGMQRVTTTDVALHGITIPARQMVTNWILSANYDERQFPDPERFDIRRHPNRHQAFGHGIHYCLGAPLARLEARIALEILLERFPGLSLVPGREIVPHESIYVLGVQNLPVIW